jgi:acetylornithine deacetylase
LVGGEAPDAMPGQLADFLTHEAGIDFAFEMTPPWIREPALLPRGADEIIALLGAAINAECGSHRVHPVAYGTDAATIAWSGVPAVIFGPGDIAQAHTKDEWLDLGELEQATAILLRLARSIESTSPCSDGGANGGKM